MNASEWIRQNGRFCASLRRGGLLLRKIRIPAPAIAGLRIFYFSDLHFRSDTVWNFPCPPFFRDGASLPDLCPVMEEFPADIQIFGGDLAADSYLLPGAFEFLRRLPPAPLKLAVNGNWDLYRRPWIRTEVWRDHYASAGFRLLCNEQLAWQGITFTGLDDFKTGVPAMPPQTVDAMQFHIVLSHNPDGIPATSGAERASLALCGHTHGGQWRIPGYGALITSSVHGKTFEYGIYRNARTEMEMIVSAGIGTTWFPSRIFCPPEVLYIEFTS